MFDTYVTIVGNALHQPEMRRTATTGALVTTFKIASTARRMDRESGRWVDGNSLRVRVTCWRALATNVKQSVTVGDPLVVTGRLFTRDWEDENGLKRTAYELEAMAVGHDLSRGRAVFERVRPRTSTSGIEDADAAQRVAGELTDPVPDDEAPVQFDDTPFDAVIDQPAAPDLPDFPGDGYREDATGGNHPAGVAVADQPESASTAALSPIGGGDESGTGPVDEPEEPAATRRRGGRRAKVPA